jgi:hypothetical protein
MLAEVSNLAHTRKVYHSANNPKVSQGPKAKGQVPVAFHYSFSKIVAARAAIRLGKSTYLTTVLLHEATAKKVNACVGEGTTQAITPSKTRMAAGVHPPQSAVRLFCAAHPRSPASPTVGHPITRDHPITRFPRSVLVCVHQWRNGLAAAVGLPFRSRPIPRDSGGSWPTGFWFVGVGFRPSFALLLVQNPASWLAPV